MKLSFPYMGDPLIYDRLFSLLGHEVVLPPKPGKKTFDLGVKYSPEFACFPLKVLMGTYLEVIEKGVDTIVTSGGQGPCRAGYYAEVHKKIIDDHGKEVDFIILDEPAQDWKRFYNNLVKLKGNKSWFTLFRAVKTAYQLARSKDKIQRIVETSRPYVKEKDKYTRVWRDILDDYSNIESSRDIKKVELKARKKLSRFDTEKPPKEKRIKIGIIGEIYVVMESSVNKNITNLLNKYGVEVELSHYISSWIYENLIPFAGGNDEKIASKAEDYIEIMIGGHAQHNVGHIVDYKQRGFDGVIHLKPFGCLPEIITQSMLDKISEDLDIPVLGFSLDEQTARANMITRVEAFLDMVKQKKYVSGEV